MTRFARAAVRNLLRRFDRQLIHLPRERASGIDLAHDLRLVIPHEHPTCLDVGANVGDTVEVLHQALDRPIVHAFEPSSVVFPVLSARQFSGTTVLHRFAMGSALGQAELTNFDASWMTTLLPLDPARHPHLAPTPTGREVVDVRTVDWFMEQERIPRVDYLKIDAQGFELEVLKGAGRSLRRGEVRSVLVELMFTAMYVGQPAPLEIMELLFSAGFALVDQYDKLREGHRLARCNALFVYSRPPAVNAG